VIWTDEFTFKVGKDYRMIWVTRRRDEDQAYLSKNYKPSFKSGRISIGVWGAFCGVKKGLLVVLGSSHIDQHRYREEILAPFGLPFYRAIRAMQLGKEEVHWMEDGARYHNTKANRNWIVTKAFVAMR
jgi:hypothetical protein